MEGRLVLKITADRDHDDMFDSRDVTLIIWAYLLYIFLCENLSRENMDHDYKTVDNPKS